MIISMVASPIPPATTQKCNDRQKRGKDTRQNTPVLPMLRDNGNQSSSVFIEQKFRGKTSFQIFVHVCVRSLEGVDEFRHEQ